MARASAAAGDAVGRAEQVAAAQAALDQEPNEEDRAVVAGQLSTVPEVR
jgi:hypothetical protein